MKSIRREPSKGSLDLPRRLRWVKPSSVNAFWMLCVLAAGLTLGAACGPQQEFCPNTGSMMGGKCPIVGDEYHPANTDGGPTSTCPDGTHLTTNPDGNILGICVPN